LINEVHDAYFDFDKHNLRDDAISVLTNNAEALKAIFKDFPNVNIVLEGHCDERGSAEYNLGLGDRRSTSVKEYLEQLGITAERLITVSYGKERPQCTEGNEACWQKNRRVHFVPGEKQKSTITEMEHSKTGLEPRS
jgi:peptidoglycan-associated lipoprotein